MRQAIDIADLLVWVYTRQQAHNTVETNLGPRMGYMDCCERIHQGAALGISSSGGGASSKVHDDAEDVHMAALKLGPPWLGILIDFGKSGIVPDWMPGAVPIIRPKFKKGGKPVMIRDNHGKAICQALEVVLSKEEIAFRREVYSLWHQALTLLAESLKKIQLSDYIVTGPQAPANPWLLSPPLLPVDSRRENLT